MVMKEVGDRLTRKHGVFQLQACNRCTLVVTRPRPTAQALGRFYEGTYSGEGAPRAKLIQTSLVGRAVARYRLWAVQRIRALKPGVQLLDVGCGYGAFVACAVQHTGCTGTGIEMDAGCVAHALDADVVDYRCGTLDSVALQHEAFDVITFFESLEHHADPIAALKSAHALLKPGGSCVVEVPNFNGAWRRVFGSWWLPLLVPQHLAHFTPRTLRDAFEAAGFRVTQPHRAMFYPGESTASLGLWLNDLLGRPIRHYRLNWSRPDGIVMLIGLMLWWAAIDLPSQFVLALIGRTGHQLMAGTRL